MLETVDGRYAARLVMPRSSADELQRPLFSCSPRSTIAPRAPRVMWSSFESETGAIFDAQPSLTVVYDTSKLTNCARTTVPTAQLGAQEALQRSCYTCTVKIVTKWPT